VPAAPAGFVSFGFATLRLTSLRLPGITLNTVTIDYLHKELDTTNEINVTIVWSCYWLVGRTAAWC